VLGAALGAHPAPARAEEPAPSAAPARAEEPARAPGGPTAEERPAVIAVVAAAADRFGQRVQAELSSLGFQVIRLDPPDAPTSRVSLEAAARHEGAVAAIRAVPSARGVEVWITDRVTGKTVLREIVLDAGTPDPESALAIRTVELLRASLLEVALPEAPPGEVPATPALRAQLDLPAPGALAKRSPPTLRLSLAPGALLSPGGFGPAAALDVGLAWMPGAHVGASAFATVPLTRPRVVGTAGTADLAALLVGASVRFVFTERESAWAPSLDVGVAALSLSLSGAASAGYRARAASAWTAAPYARLGLAYAVTSLLRLRADLLAGVAADSVAVQLAGHDAATFGRPLVAPSVGVDFGWF
jgi:hypothetical protein